MRCICLRGVGKAELTTANFQSSRRAAGMASGGTLPADAAAQVARMKELERGILAAVDRVAGGGGAASSSSFAAGGGKMKRDPAHLARVGMSKLRRELRELEGIAEEQDRATDRAAVLDALEQRVASHDGIRRILRDATLEAANRAPEEEEEEEEGEEEEE